MKKARIFHIVCNVTHPETGETLMTREQIENALSHKTIQKWAFILHDKDDGVNPHWHIITQSSQLPVDKIAEWFKIPVNFVDIPKGNHAGKFIDCLEYLTHSNRRSVEEGKHIYDDSEIISNFLYRKEIDDFRSFEERVGVSLDQTERVFYKMLFEGYTLRQCEKEYPLIYMRQLKKLTTYRLDYIKRSQPPANRINYYIYGKGGSGKDLLSRAIARALFPEYEHDDDIFFVVGAGNATFEGYDGQPVLIWSDRRAYGLIKALGGRENVFNVFDTHPTKQRQNIKFNSINLCNTVNIVNGQESYQDFLNELTKEYTDADGKFHESEDKNQSYRRFPFIIPIHDEDFDILVNKGYIDNDYRYFQSYYEYNNIRGNMQRIVKCCGGENELSRRITSQVIYPIVSKHNEALENHSVAVSEDYVLRLMEEEGWGTQLYSSDGRVKERHDLSEEETRQRLRLYGCEEWEIEAILDMDREHNKEIQLERRKLIQ